MKRILMAIYDSKAQMYDEGVQSFVSTGVAVRAFTAAVNDPKTSYHQYPDDFALFKLGEYDDVTGAIVKEEPLPLLVVMARTVLVAEKVDKAQLPLKLEA